MKVCPHCLLVGLFALSAGESKNIGSKLLTLASSTFNHQTQMKTWNLNVTSKYLFLVTDYSSFSARLNLQLIEITEVSATT